MVSNDTEKLDNFFQIELKGLGATKLNTIAILTYFEPAIVEEEL